VQALDADFYTFSAHKLYGPTGMGALYVRYEILDSMSPWMGGGDMITTVSFEQSNYAPVPQRFEAGTPNIAGAITMAAAIDYVMGIGMQRIADHEALLLDYATEALLAMPGIRIIGTAAHKAGIVSFLVDGIHPHDLGTILDMDGVAVRAGHHCAMPLMTRFGIPGTARASFALYNDYADIDALLGSLRKAQKLFGVG
jgi:cysteine desulfurase/selenocysteine lyase